MTPQAHGPRGVVATILGVYPIPGTHGYAIVTDDGNAYRTLTPRLGNYSVADRPLTRSLILLDADDIVRSVETI